MLPLNLSWDYHDSVIIDVIYSSDNSVTLTVNLDGCWNEITGNPIRLVFYDVRNLDEVRRTLTGVTDANRDEAYVDEIYAICLGVPRGFVIHLRTHGEFYIDADTFSEC